MNRFLLKKTCIVFLILVGAISSSQLSANNNASNLVKAQTWADNTSNQNHFIENKGQIMQTDGQPAAYVNHLLQRGNTYIYLLREGGIAYQFNRMHYPIGYQKPIANRKNEHENMGKLQIMQGKIRLETYRMDMHLVDANPNAEIITEGKSHDYTNYYTHNTLFVHHYQKITYKNIYPGIDWVIYTTEEGGMKYDFVVQVGADPSVIKMKFTHQEELYLDKKGNLIHSNRMGSFTEKAPISFQEDKSIATQFVLKDNILSFALENYNPNSPLTIDPARIWGTYYGGNIADEGYSCVTDISENVYLAGISISPTNIAFGGHQNSLGGDFDAFLVKFNSSGVRLWATYYGGSGTDYGWSCTSGNNNNIYLAGTTESTTNIASGGHQNIHGGATYDAFLVKFDSTGVRQWSTYYGGNNQDRGNSCATDNSGNVYLAGRTSSTTNIAFNGHQNSIGGNDVAFLVKFSNSGVRQWGTYYGNDITNGNSCTTDGSGNVYLAGSTSSPTNIAFGGHQNIYGGANYDAYLVKFNSLGVRLWSTYYGGSGADWGNSCATDNNGNIFLAGGTGSNNNIASGGHQNIYGGTGDAFLVKFNSSGIRQWGTYYGDNGDDDGQSCVTDKSGNIYLAGSTGSTANIASNGHQNIYGGGQYDIFLIKLDSLGIRQWGTYYGGNTVEYQASCATDSSGNVYLAGRTASFNNIAFNGHQNTIGNGFNAFLVKFDGTSVVNINENIQQLRNISVYPNPNNGVFNIVLEEKSNIEIFNVLGEQVYINSGLNNNIQIDISNQPKGIYFINIKGEKSNSSLKTIIN